MYLPRVDGARRRVGPCRAVVYSVEPAYRHRGCISDWLPTDHCSVPCHRKQMAFARFHWFLVVPTYL
jgi:hypothetical protein